MPNLNGRDITILQREYVQLLAIYYLARELIKELNEKPDCKKVMGDSIHWKQMLSLLNGDSVIT